jgi:signal transduction histidine kinase
MVGELVRVTVSCDQQAPRTVREHLARLPDVGWRLGDAMLIASELVSNAIRHSRASPDQHLTVIVHRDADRLRISVRDPGTSGTNAVLASEPDVKGGFGLRIVEQLASRWGTERRTDGYEVWAELELPAG